MSEAILSAFPKGTEVFLPQGGQYLWVKMPEHIIADELFFEAAEKDILLAPGTLFNRQGHYRNCLRFCYAQELTQAILDAIEYTGSLANR
jgi:2-aminoadipate transaminase